MWFGQQGRIVTFGAHFESGTNSFAEGLIRDEKEEWKMEWVASAMML